MAQATATLTSSQIAEAARVSVRTVHRRVAAGDLTPVMKLPGKTGAYIFDAADAERVFGIARFWHPGGSGMNDRCGTPMNRPVPPRGEPGAPKSG